MLGISDDVVEGHAGSAATHHDAAQNLCLAFTSLTAGEKCDRCTFDFTPGPDFFSRVCTAQFSGYGFFRGT